MTRVKMPVNAKPKCKRVLYSILHERSQMGRVAIPMKPKLTSAFMILTKDMPYLPFR